jgi:hypothetical protein
MKLDFEGPVMPVSIVRFTVRRLMLGTVISGLALWASLKFDGSGKRSDSSRWRSCTTVKHRWLAGLPTMSKKDMFAVGHSMLTFRRPNSSIWWHITPGLRRNIDQ